MRKTSCLLLVMILPACGTDRATADNPAPAIRDSAGVQIVEYAGLPLSATQWNVSDTPDVVIGTEDGDTTTVFGRVSGLAEGSNGVILVADGRAQEVRAFNPDGTHRWTANSMTGPKQTPNSPYHCSRTPWCDWSTPIKPWLTSSRGARRYGLWPPSHKHPSTQRPYR